MWVQFFLNFFAFHKHNGILFVLRMDILAFLSRKSSEQNSCLFYFYNHQLMNLTCVTKKPISYIPFLLTLNTKNRFVFNRLLTSHKSKQICANTIYIFNQNFPSEFHCRKMARVFQLIPIFLHTSLSHSAIKVRIKYFYQAHYGRVPIC